MKFLLAFAKLSLGALCFATIGRGATINHHVVITIVSKTQMTATFDGAPRQVIQNQTGHWHVQLFLGREPYVQSWLEHGNTAPANPNGLVNLLTYSPAGGGSFNLDSDAKRGSRTPLRDGAMGMTLYPHPDKKDTEQFLITVTDLIH